VTLSLALLFGGLPGAFLDYLLNQLPIEYMVVTFGSLVLPGSVGLMFVKFFIGNVLGVLVLGAMTPPVLAEAAGGRASLADSLGAIFPVTLSLIGLGIMVGLGVVVGLTLLILPAFIIFVLWALAAPAVVAEREGAFLALTRSQELSEGARWKSIGVLAVPLAASLLIGAIFSFVSVMMFGRPSFGQVSTGQIVSWVVVGVIVNLLWSSIQASLYVELRDWKDGPAAENLEQIFA
jgi:hypothetical protein